MYKIYINSNRLILCDKTELKDLKVEYPSAIIFRYSGKIKSLPNYIDRLEKRKNVGDTLIYSTDYMKLKEDFKSLFIQERAAGTMVVNKYNELLMIYRRGHLDLPKGKIEKKESLKHAAIRELIEETSIKKACLIGKIIKTRHSFRNASNKRVRKITHWYLCESKAKKFIPQKSEDIEWVKWMSQCDIIESDIPVYKNIIDVIVEYNEIEMM